jgi:hypothetical protein
MNYYKVCVQIQSKNGQRLFSETYRNYKNDKDIFIFAKGYAQGLAHAHEGYVMEIETTKLKTVEELMAEQTESD